MERSFKITGATLDVMEALLVSGDDVHGYAIAQAARKPTGSVYPIMARLETAGLLDSHWETEEPIPGRPRKKLYRLTPTGRAAVREILLERRGRLPEATSRRAPGSLGWGTA
ncbi:PadR family transcriptional regulator [Streptomyces rubiginosohelvolus]|uniref:PadR family transcriptional regulator n=1 Tax=Streptomyces rubiginosohelvolus TaxID=67362 RepID=UPI00341015D9